MKRYRTLVVLVLLLAVLGALALLDRRRPSTDEAAHLRGRILPAFARAQTTRIELARRDGRTVALRHEASGWWLSDPRRRADDATVESLLAVLELGQIERNAGVADATAKKTFGLDPPLVVVRAGDHTLRIGGDGPGSGVYLQRDDEPGVLVAEHRLVEAADLDPALWRLPHATLSDPAGASRIAFGGWSVARDRGWRVTTPVIARASDEKVDALVQSLIRAHATAELDHARANANDGGVALAPGGGASPAVAASGGDVLALDGGVPLALDGVVEARVDGPCPNVPASATLARADGATLCFAATDFDSLRAPVTTLYERRLFPMRLDDVRALDVSTPTSRLSLRRDNGTWRLTAPRSESGVAADDKVRALVQQLLDAGARAFSPAAPAAPIRVRLATADDDITVELASSGGITLARRAGETLSLEIDPAILDALAAATPANLKAVDGGTR